MVVGRIDGWKDYDSQEPLSVVALKLELDRLSYIIEGTKLIKDMAHRSCRQTDLKIGFNFEKLNPMILCLHTLQDSVLWH